MLQNGSKPKVVRFWAIFATVLCSAGVTKFRPVDIRTYSFSDVGPAKAAPRSNGEKIKIPSRGNK